DNAAATEINAIPRGFIVVRLLFLADVAAALRSSLFLPRKWWDNPAATLHDLIVCDASSQCTGPLRKYDSFAMWHASAAWCPTTTSGAPGLRARTASKNFHRCGRRSS